MRIGRSSSRPQPLVDDGRASSRRMSVPRSLSTSKPASVPRWSDCGDARHARGLRRASARHPRLGASTWTYIVSAPFSRAVRFSGVSTATTRPLLMMTTRWQVCATSGRMCVLRTIVWSPARLRISCRVSMICFGVEAGGRLVEDQDFRIVDQRLAEADALPVALRELAAVAVGHVGDVRACFITLVDPRLASPSAARP